MGEGLVRPWGPYPGASNSCISISPGFLGIEGRPLGLDGGLPPLPASKSLLQFDETIMIN